MPVAHEPILDAYRVMLLNGQSCAHFFESGGRDLSSQTITSSLGASLSTSIS